MFPIKPKAIWQGLGLVVLCLLGRPVESLAVPSRIVSLNLCTDELVVRLADPSRIASVTWLSHDAGGSNVAHRALHFPANHGLAEQVLRYDPDLIIAGAFTTRTAVAMLKRTPIRVEEFGIPTTMNDLRQQILRMGDLVGAPERASILLRNLDARLMQIANDKLGFRPTAIVLNPNGFTVGSGTLVDQIMTIAGLDNISAKAGGDFRGQVPLEFVASHEIDILIVSAARDGPPSLATNLLSHPILSKLPKTKIVVMPGRYWSCAGPAVADAAQLLHEAAQLYVAERAGP